MERRRHLDAEEERLFSPGRDAAQGSAARTLDVGSARLGRKREVRVRHPCAVDFQIAGKLGPWSIYTWVFNPGKRPDSLPDFGLPN